MGKFKEIIKKKMRSGTDIENEERRETFFYLLPPPPYLSPTIGRIFGDQGKFFRIPRGNDSVKFQLHLSNKIGLVPSLTATDCIVTWYMV